MNSVNLVGRLTKDPEIVERGKTKVCDLRLAVNGQGDMPPLFVDVATFKGQAEACSKYLVKGSLVAVSGSLRLSQWETDGHRRSRHSVIARQVDFLDRRSQDESAEEQPSAEAEEQPTELAVVS